MSACWTSVDPRKPASFLAYRAIVFVDSSLNRLRSAAKSTTMPRPSRSGGEAGENHEGFVAVGGLGSFKRGPADEEVGDGTHENVIALSPFYFRWRFYSAPTYGCLSRLTRLRNEVVKRNVSVLDPAFGVL